MDAALYQQALGLAGMSNLGLDTDQGITQFAAASVPAVYDENKVQQMTDLFTMSNQEKYQYYYEEILPTQTPEMQAQVKAEYPDVESFVSLVPVKQDLGMQEPVGPAVNIPGTPTFEDFGPPDLGLVTAGMPDIAAIVAGLTGVVTGIKSAVDAGGIAEILAGLGIAATAGYGLYEMFNDDGSMGGSGLNGGESMASGTTSVAVSGGTSVGGVSFGGPGVPEPPASMVMKAWKTKSFSKTVGEYWVYFWKLTDGRILSWNAAKREAKIWRPKKPIVLYRGSVTLSQAVKTQQMLDKLWRTVAKKTKQLKLA